MPLDPTTSVIFALYGNTGAPLTGAVPVFTTYETLAGVPVTPQPSIVEIGGGMYGFTPYATDISNGTAYVIDGTASANPRYSAGGLQPGVNVNVDVASILAIVTTISNYLSGRWEIVTSGAQANQMVFYAPDNVTQIAVFNLLDVNGNPTTTNIMQRTVA